MDFRASKLRPASLAQDGKRYALVRDSEHRVRGQVRAESTLAHEKLQRELLLTLFQAWEDSFQSLQGRWA